MITASSEPLFVQLLGAHHFAHLRAVAEGVPVMDSALRYLGIHHGNQAVSAHRETVDAVRAVARRHSEKTWRLVGLAIPLGDQPAQPTLEEFAETTSWASGFSEAELLEAYEERYPPGQKPTRRLRLRESLLATLARIEKLVVVPPKPSDALSGWFDKETADRLAALNLVTLADLNTMIASDPKWHATAKAIGVIKAERIEQHLGALVPLLPKKVAAPEEAAIEFPIADLLRPALLGSAPPSPLLAIRDANFTAPGGNGAAAPGARGLVRQVTSDSFSLPDPLTRPVPGTVTRQPYSPPPDSLLAATDDVAAIFEWVQVVVGSTETAKTYLREARRFLIWLQRERELACLADLKVIDCKAYMEFLADIPAPYLSDPKSRAKPGTPGWAPFRGQLDKSSRQQSIVIIASMYSWLASGAYLPRNPWAIVNKNVVTKRATKQPTSKAISEPHLDFILDYIDSCPPSPDRARIKFIFRFLESVGLRSNELISAKIKDLSLRANGWFLRVEGKGDKVRDVSISNQAMVALQEYLASRRLPSVEYADGDIPLVAHNRDPKRPIGYPALYAHVKQWLQEALASPGLNTRELELLAGASTHWLRHTFGTRSVERGVPHDVIQAQMGHASIKTTIDTYGRAPEKRLADEIAKAFGGPAGPAENA